MKKYLFAVLCAFMGLSGCQTTNAPLPATQTIYFKNDSAIVSPMGQENIKNFVEAHKTAGYHDGYMVYISGYTNSVGKESYNQTLSERRAEAVRQALLANGIAAWRITGKGYGELYPAADNKTLQGLRMNRRVVIGFEPADHDK